MNKLVQFLVMMLFLFSSTFNLFAQSQSSNFDAHKLWNPFFYPHYGNQYRSANGAPGIDYWQNSVNYKIACTLDTTNKKLTGNVTISYTNNSPDSLSFLWLQMEQNIYRKDSRGTATQSPNGGRFANRSYTKGYQLKSVEIVRNGKTVKADYLVNDTRMQIRLKKPLDAKGGKIEIKIAYSFKIPKYGTDRMGRLLTKNGWIYEIAQWYPRMCVYDDVDGWNTIPYMGAGEFYLEYGNIDYTVTAPANMIVVGAGKLMNPQTVLTETERERLKKASNSDSTVFIRTPKELKNPTRPQKGMLTWHFQMKNTRDVAWAASKAFVWDAARINLPKGKKALAQSVYPIESAGDSAWGRSTEFTKACIEHYSKMWYPFPYPVATNVAGLVHGMEYPGFVFCYYKSKGRGLWGVTIHEFGHSWFPMIVGSNERKFPFMDEGFNTFLNAECTKWFNHQEFYKKRNVEKEAHHLFYAGADPILTIPDVTQHRNLGVAAYGKPALGLELLRNVILGKKRFDYAFRTYIKRWAFHHPTPWDFFRTIENASGEDLSWFWQEWFFKNYELDQAVDSVTYVKDSVQNGALIAISNLKKMALPAIVEVKEKNGKDSTFTLPVEIWQRGANWTFKYPSKDSITSVILDPNHVLPDMNSKNNIWDIRLNRPIPKNITAESILEKYVSAIGGESNLKKVKSLEITDSGNMYGNDMDIIEKYKSPNMISMIMFPQGNDSDVIYKMVVNGDNVMIRFEGRNEHIDKFKKAALENYSNAFQELNYLKGDYKLKLVGYALVNNHLTYQIHIEKNGTFHADNFYDVKTGFKLKSVDVNGESYYSDYKEVDGIKFPFSATTNNDRMKLTVKKITINKKLNDSNFEIKGK